MATKSKNRKAIQVIPQDSSAGNVEYYVTSSSDNAKTGDVPTVWIGDSKAQTARSCFESGCPLLGISKGGKFDPQKTEKNGCYAWNGTVQMGIISIWKTIQKHGKARYLIDNALSLSKLSSKLIRVTAIGDVVSLTEEQRNEIVDGVAKHNKEFRSEQTKLRFLGYTHGWRKENMFNLWGKLLMASVHSLEEADEAFDQGWRPAAEMTFDADPGRVVITPKGRKLMVCPHLLSEKLKPKMVEDCNNCGWCVVEDNKRNFGIIFPNHK